ncbi:MAG TPA: IS3 family transposase [Rhizobium sp.]
MGKGNFSDDFKRDAVRQITERGYPVAEVSQRLGVSQHSLYEWKKKFGTTNAKVSDEVGEIRRLKKELAVTEERDILKKRPRTSPRMQSEVRVHRRASTAVLGANDVPLPAHPSQWFLYLAQGSAEQTRHRRHATNQPAATVLGRERQGLRLSEASRRPSRPRRDMLPNRVARLTRLAGIKAQIGYKRRPGIYGGRPSIVVDNTLDRQFNVEAPDRAWVTDITYIRTAEGFAYLAVVIDLYSRRVIGWSMQSRQTTDVVLQALLMAVWRRKPKGQVLIHSDQGSQFTSMDWASFLKHHNLVHSMSRRENCHDNAVAESFFNLLKRERIRRKVYRSRDEARTDVFDYIEMFYNPKRKHVRNGMLSPVEFEKQQKT